KKTFEDKTVTQKIVDDFVKKTIDDPFGVIVFCATVKHAQEVFDLLPEGKAVLLHGGLSNAERKKAIHLYKTQQVKYLVNRDIASVGFDAPWSAHCVLMRSLGSNRLAQQMFWRVVRLYDGKEVSTIHDYGNNIENLFNGSSDIFTPLIKAYGSKPSVQIEVMCEYCGTLQEFSKRQGFEQWDPFGYAVDLAGDRLDPPVPAHHGRRCTGVTPLGKNQFAPCDYYWTHRTCEDCGAKSDIASRFCPECGKVFINPEDKLSETATFIPVGEQATTIINSMSVRHGEVLHVEWGTPHGTLKSRFFPNHKQWAIAHHGKKFLKETDHGNKPPRMITYTKQKTGYCSINEYHQI
ncbi:DEAD/DEAH box helicase, partial [Jeotgalibaca porci]|uniref:DEAD/DEAH box helicase n=1 Tax=Jeotgalibaca porci TaxID=1868793 RepID=UPI00359F78E4